MALVFDLIFFAVAVFVLVQSSVLVVKGLSKIARFFQLKEFIIGFLLLAFATSLPELFVGISASIAKSPALALGNVVGSNIANIGLVIGITILVGRGIKVHSRIVRDNSYYTFLVVLLPVVLMIDGKLGRIDGIFLICVAVLYFIKEMREKRSFSRVSNDVTGLQVFNYAVLFIVAMILVVISSNFVVKYASLLSEDLNLAPILIGLFLLAVGTSLPELAVGLRAVTSGHKRLVLGEIMGSNIINSTLVLGVAALIFPIVADYSLFLVSAIFMLFIMFLFMMFVHTKRELSVREGVILLLMYILFVFVEFGMLGIK